MRCPDMAIAVPSAYALVTNSANPSADTTQNMKRNMLLVSWLSLVMNDFEYVLCLDYQCKLFKINT